MDNVRALLKEDHYNIQKEAINNHATLGLKDVIEDLINTGKKVVLTTGKEGVGKTTVAAAIAVGLAERGKKVHFMTINPGVQLQLLINKTSGITMSHIAYLEGDLKSSDTREIAAFRALEEIIEKNEEQVIVIDTAPTEHTLLLLESTQGYEQEEKCSQCDNQDSQRKILRTMRNTDETEVIIVTLEEATSVYEAMRLEDDLRRAEINTKWWVIEPTHYNSQNTNDILSVEASDEISWINKVDSPASGNYAIIGWSCKK